MSKDIKVDVRQLEQLRKTLEATEKNIDVFMESCVKELAARLLAKVIKRTPVGQYPKGSGKVGGTLRRGWTTQKSGSGSEGLNAKSASQFVDTLKIHHFGDAYVIEIVNSVEYASYVEYGHRTADYKGWVPGRLMLTISEEEIRQAAPHILEAKIKKWLSGVLK